MQLESRKYLHDVQRALTLVRQFTAGKSLADYESDEMLKAAVERQFEIAGEALSQLARNDSETVERIGDYRRIIAFRNVLIHGYADIDSRLVWTIAETRAVQLLHEVSELLEEP